MRISIAGNFHHNKEIYRELAGISPERQAERFTAWCMWAKRNGFNVPEYLLPQLQIDTEISSFAFERQFADAGKVPPPTADLAKLAPWDYQVEMGSASTRGMRKDGDWKFHRYRKSLLVSTAKQICGERAPSLSVLDVACHCGVFSLEFAAQGFGSVAGIDLRAGNIEQANFLKRVFGLPNTSFSQLNARDLATVEPADVTLCVGLFYHVTFPMELLKDLFQVTRDFLLFDSLCQNHPFSAFHLICGKDVNYSAEGEVHYQFNPTYRAICDAIQAVGFPQVYELFGSHGNDVNLYSTGNRRTFIAIKNPDGLAARFLSKIKAI